jgi:hypothetical protein
MQIETRTYVQASDQQDFSGMHFSENLNIGRLHIHKLLIVKYFSVNNLDIT